MSKTATNATATATNATKTNATKTATNATATNFSYDVIMKMFIDNGLRLENDLRMTQKNVYIGYGKRFNDFSVNMKKSLMNVYCTDEMFDKCKSIMKKLTATEFIENGNSGQRINNKIVCKSLTDLNEMLMIVAK